MYTIIAKCDGCGKTETRDRDFWFVPDGWRQAELKLTQYHGKKYLFCDECCEAMGIARQKEDDSLADKLVGIIHDIACEAAQSVKEG